MPITLSAPPVTGSLLQGMLQGWDTGSANARADEASQVSALLRGMYIRELQRKQALEGNVAPALAGLSALTPETYTPSLPGGQPMPAVPTQMEGAMEAPPSLAPTLPAVTPAPVTGSPVTGLTYSKIASALGPEKFQALLGTEQGRLALKTSGAITDEEFNQRKRLADARTAFEDESQKAMEAYGNGDSQAGLLAQAAGLRHLASAVDPQHVAPLMARVDELMRFYIAAKKDKQELGLQDQDAPIFAKAMKDYIKAGDPDALVDGISQLRSQYFRKKGDDALHTLAQGIEMKNPTLTQFWKAYGTAWDAARMKGQANPDPKDVLRTALTAVPQAAPELLQVSLTGRRPLPDTFQEVLFGKSYPKTAYEAAGRAVTDSGVPVNDPRFGPMFLQKLREAEQAAKPEKETTVADLSTLLKSHETDLRDLIAERRTLEKPSDRLIMPPTEQAAVNQRDRDLQTQIADKKKVIAEYQRRLDQAVGMKHPKTAPPGTPQPIPPAAPVAPAPTPPVQAAVPGPGPAVPTPTPTPAPASPKFGGGAPDVIALKGRRDALVVSMFPGKAWDELEPEQKQAVADAMNKPGP